MVASKALADGMLVAEDLMGKSSWIIFSSSVTTDERGVACTIMKNEEYLVLLKMKLCLSPRSICSFVDRRPSTC